ncbi:hypothetical protein BH11ACT4_BH11ACT4_18250 [soil metagenome]
MTLDSTPSRENLFQFLARHLRRRAKVNVFEVFTPTTQARANFVKRPTVERRLETALRTPGTQVIVFGESGSGKSTLLLNQLSEMRRGHVTTRCTASDTFGSILLAAFDQLDQWVATQRAERNQSETLDEIAIQIGELKAGTSSRQVRGTDTTFAPIVGPQLAPQKLGQLLGAAGKSWIIEDFHKIPSAEKVALAQTLKVFSDLAIDYPLVRIVVVGATDSAKEVVEYDPEMNTRVSEVYVPPLDEPELRRILENGGKLLNASFGLVSAELIRHSVGVASVAHHLALNCMLHLGIEKPADRMRLVRREDLKAAAEQYVQQSSATLKERFDKGVVRVRVRHFDNGRLIIGALAVLPMEGALHSEILAEIQKTEPDYPSGNLTTNAKALMTEEKGALVRKGTDGRFRFAEPLLHTYARLVFVKSNESTIGDLFAESLTALFSSGLYSSLEIRNANLAIATKAPVAGS